VEHTVTAPSGRTLGIVSADDCPVIGVNTFVTFGPGAWMRNYQIGRHGYHDAACNEIEPAELIWRDYVAGNELMVSSNSRSVTVATLRGPYHELTGVFGGPTPPRDRVRRVFLDIDVVDRPTGMSVRPAPGNPMGILWEDATIVVQDRGIIHVVGADNAAAMVPNVRGTQTKFGEVWRHDVAGSRTNDIYAVHFIVAQSHAAAEVSFRMSSTTPEEELLTWIDNLQIAWS
jgi:hypothetical protein